MLKWICVKNFTHMRKRNFRFNLRLNTFCFQNPEDGSGLILYIILAKSRLGGGGGVVQLTSSSLLDAKKTIITPLLELRVNQPQLEPLINNRSRHASCNSNKNTFFTLCCLLTGQQQQLTADVLCRIMSTYQQLNDWVLSYRLKKIYFPLAEIVQFMIQ
jgi:hypothetical protein